MVTLSEALEALNNYVFMNLSFNVKKYFYWYFKQSVFSHPALLDILFHCIDRIKHCLLRICTVAVGWKSIMLRFP